MCCTRLALMRLAGFRLRSSSLCGTSATVLTLAKGRGLNARTVSRFASKSGAKTNANTSAALPRHAAASSLAAKAKSFVQGRWTKYTIWLEEHPLKTKVATAAVIAAIGDVNCQLFIESSSSLVDEEQVDGEVLKENSSTTGFDWKRAIIFTLIGGAIAPILHGWYGRLGRLQGANSLQTLGKRLVLDQFGFAPTFLPVFFAVLLTLEGNIQDIPTKIRNDWWPALKTNWIIWIPAQMINFSLVRGNLQVLFANVVGMFWNSYLSYISHVKAPALPEQASGDKNNKDASDLSTPKRLQ